MLRAVLVYAVLALLFVSPALAPGRTLSASDVLWGSTPWTAASPAGVGLGSNVQLGDQARVFLPFLERTRDSLPHVPLWNPALMAGRPFLANGQSAVFSPFNVPSYVLPMWRSLALGAALKLFVAALGTFLLARALGMRFGAALLSGVVFALSLWFVAWLTWPLTSTWAFLPWLWLAADAVARRPGLLPACGLAAVVGLQFLGGHPESSFHVLAFTVVFFAARLVQLSREQPGAPLARSAAALAGATALGAALAAATLLPLAELLSNSADNTSREGIGGLHIPARYTLGLFLNDYWGRPTSTQIDPFQNPVLHTRAFYVGALPLMLVAIALLTRRSFGRLMLAGFGALALAVAVGVPPLPAILGALPGFDVTNNSRFAVLFALCMALLAGWGLDDLLERRDLVPRRAALALAAAILVAPVAWILVAGQSPRLSVLGDSLGVAWGFADWPRTYLAAGPAELDRLLAETRLAALLEWLVLAGAGIGLLALRLTGRLRGPIFAGLAVALVAADLFKAGVGINPAIPVETAAQPVTPAIRYLQGRAPNRFVGLRSTSPLGAGNPIPVDVAMRYGLLDARGYDFPIEDRYMQFWRSEIAGGDCPYHFCTSGAVASDRSLRALSMLSVTDLLANPSDPPLNFQGLSVAYDGPDGRVYSNSRALARVFLVDRQRIAADDDAALAAVESTSFDPVTAAVTEEEIAGIPVASAAPEPPGTARLIGYDDELVRIAADADRTSILVLTDTYFPGWEATVDGESVPVHRVDYLLRGIQLDPGRHVVEFRYDPASWRIGVAVSAAALALLLVLTGVGLRRRLMGRTGLEPVTSGLSSRRSPS